MSNHISPYTCKGRNIAQRVIILVCQCDFINSFKNESIITEWISFALLNNNLANT